MSTLAIALTFFIVANPLGNSPTILSLVKNYDFDRQRKIILREGIFAFLIAIFFQFFGEFFLSSIQVSDYSLTLTGGIVLFIVTLQMIFHLPESTESSQSKQEPFIVPIATPILSGPGLMTMIMVSSKIEQNNFKIASAITIAWIGVLAILVSSPYLQKLIGKRGMTALEQVMGLVLGLISMQMIVNGALLFAQTLK